MKNKSLAFQIWFVFASVIIGIFLLLGVLVPLTLREFFTEEVYKTIETAQSSYIKKIVDKDAAESLYDYFLEDLGDKQNMRAVTHIKFPTNLQNRIAINRALHAIPNGDVFIKKVLNKALSQKNLSERYVHNLKEDKVFYVITKYNSQGKNGFVVSFMLDTYRNSLLETLLFRLMIITILAVLISLFAALGVSKYLTKPLKRLEKDVLNIGKRNWDKPIVIDRSDEIGTLASSIETMRKELVERDEAQQWMLQNISHELKTPVMVIRSYAQSVEDGIYPKGDIKSSMEVIDEEAKRLQYRIRDLLYLTKLEYMYKHEKLDEKINLKALIERVVDRLRHSKDNITWELKLEDLDIMGKEDQWNIVIENILDNNIRYAKSEIIINLYTKEECIFITFYNNGDNILKDEVQSIFNQFKKGKKGNFGLGLSIVKQIVEFHKGTIWAENKEKGVCFIIRMLK